MTVHTIERLGTWDDVFADASPDVRAVGEALRDVVVALQPDTVEVPREGNGAVSYGAGERKMSESHCYLAPQRDRVNLGFWHGIAVPDPHGLLEGTGKRLRHMKVRDVDIARGPAVRALIEAAMEERRAALGERERQLEARRRALAPRR